MHARWLRADSKKLIFIFLRAYMDRQLTVVNVLYSGRSGVRKFVYFLPTVGNVGAYRTGTRAGTRYPI